MNRGLLAKAWRETWLVTLGFGIGLALVETLLAYALLEFQDQISIILEQVTFVKRILEALLGAELAGRLGPEIISAIAWVHPVVLTLIWAHAIVYCTRVPAGEVDRGTIDVLLGLPVSRWQIYVAETFVWLVSGAAVLLMGATGHILGNLSLTGGLPSEPRRLAIVTVNLLGVYLAAGGLSWLVSAASNRRGRAGAVAFVFVLGSFLLNYLAQFWSPAERVSFLGVLHYYSPHVILRDGAWPVGNLMALLGFGAAMWGAGGILFARRDLATL